MAVCRKNWSCLFVGRVYRYNLPWEFGAIMCRAYLPWVFCICQKIVSICNLISYIWKQNLFICEITFINSVYFCFFRGSYGPLCKTVLLLRTCFWYKNHRNQKKLFESLFRVFLNIFQRHKIQLMPMQGQLLFENNFFKQYI